MSLPDKDSNRFEGYHSFREEETREEYGSLEVFWADKCTLDSPLTGLGGGWYWWACYSGCLPDGDPSGPFNTSSEALEDARQ